MTDKLDITRVAVKAREKADSEAAYRGKAWDEAKAKEKAGIARITAEASEKVEAEADARVTEKDYAAMRDAEKSASEMIGKAEDGRAKR